MTLLLIEGDYTGVILLVLFVMFGIPLLLLIAGLALRNKNKKVSKVLFIIAVVYLIISLGYCGAMLL